MILNITADGNILYIAGVKRARTYSENEKTWVEVSSYGKQMDEIWQLTGPSFILNDEGMVLDELPHGSVETWIPQLAKCKAIARWVNKPNIDVEFTGPFVKGD